MEKKSEINNVPIITLQELLNHWQGHRRLTRKVIEAFPEKELFSYSVGEMRPFGDMAKELAGMAGMGIHGLATGEWNVKPELNYHDPNSALSHANTKEQLLGYWDQITEEIDSFWPQVTENRFREVDTAWGEYEGEIWSHFFYFIDNENHHRGQGFVYLRSLGIEPPYFWDR